MDMFPLDKNLPSVAIHKKFLEISSPYRENATSFYTDGFKLDKDHPSGVGVYSPDFNLRITYRLPPETSIFSAEAWAILLAIDASSDFNCIKTVIFSDSESVLDALAPPSSNYNKNYLIHRIKNKLLKAHKDGMVIQLFWLPAHKSIPGNKIVDSLAKKATILGYKPPFKIPYTDLYSEIRKSLGKQNFSACPFLRSLLVSLVLCTLLFFRIYALLTHGILTNLLIEKKLFLLIEFAVIITISVQLQFISEKHGDFCGLFMWRFETRH